MSDEDFALALRFAPASIEPWLMLAAYAGLRACEIAPLRGDDLDWTNRLIMIRVQKGGDPGSVPMAEHLVPVLSGRKRHGWLFPQWNGSGKPIAPGQLSRHANHYLHSLGIHSTFHSLRHRYGTLVYQASGHDLRATQELMRHNSPVSTALYTYIDPTDTRSIVNALPAPSAPRR